MQRAEYRCLTIVGFIKKWKGIETVFQKTVIQYVSCKQLLLQRKPSERRRKAKKTSSSGTGSNRLPLSGWQFWWCRNPTGVRMSSAVYGDLLIYLFLFCSLKGVNCTLSLLTVGPTSLNKPRQILMPLQPKQTINRTCKCKFFSSFLIQILIPSLKKCDCWEVSAMLVFSFQVRQKKYSNLLADRHCQPLTDLSAVAYPLHGKTKPPSETGLLKDHVWERGRGRLWTDKCLFLSRDLCAALIKTNCVEKAAFFAPQEVWSLLAAAPHEQHHHHRTAGSTAGCV